MEELFTAIRESCSPAVWSRAVELVRAGAVLGERATTSEVELRVRTPNAVATPAVNLYPEDEDWSCECDSREGACVHVAAAVIALRQARQAGKRLPGEEARAAAAKMRYVFTRAQGSLAFERQLVTGSTTQPLRATLHA